jgi:hypothetical protein
MSATRWAVAACAPLAAAALATAPASAAGPRAASADAGCPGPPAGSAFLSGDSRFAQTFTVLATGELTAVDVALYSTGTPADWRVEIVGVNHSGIPTNTVLASTVLPNATVPPGASTQSVSFSPGAPVAAGEQYAVVVTRPGSNAVVVGIRDVDPCPGALFDSSDQTADYDLYDPETDLVFTAFVEPAPGASPPETTLTRGPKAKTKKKRAIFTFISSEPGSSFRCKLDNGAFEPCTSPDELKVKKGKHHFEVRATAKGQTDASPATDDWKVKKKRKR